MPQWNPKQYLQFAAQRTQPCIDLVSRIDLPNVKYAVDLGCGPGNSTKVLANKFPAANILGLDNSHDMLAQARKDFPKLSFAHADAETWTTDHPCDVILSNAAFQWVGHHEKLFPRLMKQLRPGGMLAVQMPRNFESPTHIALREIASCESWKNKIDPREFYWVQPPGFYFDVLSPICSRVEIWETEYIHVMPDHRGIVEWYKGTGLRPYLEPLTPDEQEKFIAEYLEQLVAAYPRQKTGQVLFPFQRIFFIAQSA